ncbi:hypothetical protein HANVADRAFT_93866 [Hanseniaspora valbyensis NRRL Y-1626]|uniref:Uncharacterized protein n=1 Tax=Hanseniaspora valbyensis NRRL Y-1626 TaxID=766949 RepID=A0A1B7TB50_9ASCO|nr:hypothetical protein HANVADRAFT_93866 [Hanseniaspora valbyensis NRRL Y-1626]
MTSKRSTIANQNMHGFNKVKSNKKRNSTLLLDDDSSVIGSVGNDMSNKTNAVLASQAAMAALYNKANPPTTTTTTKKVKTKKVVTAKVTNPKLASKMKNSNIKKLPITKIVIPEDNSPNKNKIKREKVEAMYKKHSLPTAKTTYKQKYVLKNIPAQNISKNSIKTDGHHYTEFVKLQKEATALDNNVKKNSTNKSNKLHDKPLVQKERKTQIIGGALGSSTSLSSKNNVDPKNKVTPKLGLSAMAASKALSEFKNIELALEHDTDDNSSVDTFDNKLNKQSFNIC